MTTTTQFLSLNTQLVRCVFWATLYVVLYTPYSYAENSSVDNSYVEKNHLRIAIIIDDLGNSKLLGQQAIDLPGAVTYAILPFTPNSQGLAKQARAAKKEVILHMPMSNILHRETGNGQLHPDMDKPTFIAALNKALDSLPSVQGLNNHMGSELTQFYTAMQWLMEELQQRQLYFIDSRTTPHTEALNAAHNTTLASLSRDIFLDNEQDISAIDQQFNKLISIAKQRGFAVAIGHPYPSTLDYLARRIPQLKQEGIELVSASYLVEQELQVALKLKQESKLTDQVHQTKHHIAVSVDAPNISEPKI